MQRAIEVRSGMVGSGSWAYTGRVQRRQRNVMIVMTMRMMKRKFLALSARKRSLPCAGCRRMKGIIGSG